MIQSLNTYLIHDSIKDKKNRIIMLYTPKAGCTVSSEMMFDHMNILNEAKILEKADCTPYIKGPGSRCETYIQKYRNRVYFLDKRFGYPPTEKELREWFVFKMVRNPFLRAVSSYHQFCRVRWEPDYSNISFLDYLQLIDNDKIKDKSARYHYRQQYIPGEEKFVNAVIKIEYGQREIDEKINAVHSLNLRIEGRTSENHVDKTEYDAFLGKTKYNDIKIFPKSYHNFYDDEIRALVDKIYKKDLEYYKYSFNDIIS